MLVAVWCLTGLIVLFYLILFYVCVVAVVFTLGCFSCLWLVGLLDGVC